MDKLFGGKETASLGFGLMRLPEKDGAIDLDRVCDMVDAYMDAGLNYFDTAYVYHGGKSEEAVKEAIVKRYPRELFTVATKLPAWCIHKQEDVDRIFNEQLERCGVDYFDYYLLHSVEDGNNYDTYENFDCFSWGMKMKEEGKIRHFGFSYHGSPDLLRTILEWHPEVEFVQIQLNYADWENPVVRSGELYEILRQKDIPMVIMEPVKGGSLANLTPELEKMLTDKRPGCSPASWALRFCASLPGVKMILSGMSTEEQMNDNIGTFRNLEPLSEKEKGIIEEVRKIMMSKPTISCTACKYCIDGCPMSIMIPDIFRTVNTMRLYNDEFRPKTFYQGLTQRYGKASDCVACGQCESVCPQHLPVIKLLEEASELLDGEDSGR